MTYHTSRIFKSLKWRGRFGWVLLSLIVVVLISSVYIGNRLNWSMTDGFNKQVKSLVKSSTGYLVNNFQLYSGSSVKFRILKDDFLSENLFIDKIVIFDTDGNVVFDSKADNTEEQKVENTTLELSRKNEITYIYDRRKIAKVISPHFEEWGSHKYSVQFEISHEEINNEILRFELAIVIVTILLLTTFFSTSLVFATMEESRLEKEKKEQLDQLNEQRKEFMILSAHNLRTPLTNIEGNTLLLAELVKYNADQKKFLKAVLDNVGKLNNQVEEIIAITNVLAAPDSEVIKEEVAVVDSVKEIRTKLAERIAEKKIVFETDFDKGAAVHANRKYFNLILYALIDNAVKFSKEGGKVHIVATKDEKNTVISIKDSGIGIKRNEKKRIYEGFHRADAKDPLVYNHEGLGLGLYMTKILLEFLGGSITLESEEGKGSTFIVKLPAGKLEEGKKLAKAAGRTS